MPTPPARTPITARIACSVLLGSLLLGALALGGCTAEPQPSANRVSGVSGQLPSTPDPSATLTPSAVAPTTAPAATTAPVAGQSTAALPRPKAVPAGAVRVAEFLAECHFSHRLSDDPIVLPGLAGASHSHDFFGNVSTDASSTYTTLRAAKGTCKPASDRSSYWVPTLYVGDTPVAPDSATFYYLGEGVSDADRAATRPAPIGLKIVAGNATATGPDASSLARWSCLNAGHAGSSKNFVNCPAGSRLETYLDFPQCWNGRDLDSADHKSHMSYPVGGHCPASHPVSVPKLRMVLRYPVNGDPANFRLSSGPGYTMHGDFFNAWPEAELARRVRDCVNQMVKCDADGEY